MRVNIDIFLQQGPGAYNADAPLATGKPAPGGQKTSSADRYAILQRKLEDLERIHAEGKKSVRHAVSRATSELIRNGTIAQCRGRTTQARTQPRTTIIDGTL